MLTQIERILNLIPSSPNGIQTKCNWVNRPLWNPLKTSGFENGSYRASVNSRSLFSCNRPFGGLKGIRTWYLLNKSYRLGSLTGA
jgi:hypothetical protein